MTFDCTKCSKSFPRQIDLTRHYVRKIPCDRKIQCPKCLKTFPSINHLKTHENKIKPCYDKKAELELELKIEEAKIKTEEIKLKIEEAKIKSKETDVKIEEAKIKQLELKQAKKKPEVNIENSFNNNITINNINEFQICSMTKEETIENITENDVINTLRNYIKFQYNNNKFPKNKCLIIKNGKIYAKGLNKILDFDKACPYINENLKKQILDTMNCFYKIPDEILDQNGWRQKKWYMNEEKEKTVDSLEPFINNKRNNGAYKKIIKSVIEI